MKKSILVLMVLVLSIVLLAGCSGNGVTPPPVEEPPIDLIREYTGTDFVYRWPDGVVSVCDTTGQTEEIWQEINEIIDGSVLFKLTNDTTAQIGIEWMPMDGIFFVGFPQMGDFTFKKCGLGINPSTASEDVYVGAVLAVVGIHIEKCMEGFTDEMKTVIYWLYRLEPGYPLS